MKIDYILKKIKSRFFAFQKHPLTKSNPLAALSRYIKFNCIQTLFPKPRVYEWIYNLKFYAQKGDAGIVANIYYQLFDYEDSMFLIHHLNEKDLFIDIGANVGHFSLLAAGVCNANVIAFEPIPVTFVKFRKNIVLNGLTQKIKTFNIGIAEENAVLNFSKSKDVMNGVVLNDEKDVISVEVKKLDDALTGENPTFLKVDVEGYEYFVLKGASQILKNKNLKYIIIELNASSLKFGHTSEEICQFLVELDFIPVSYNVDNRKIITQQTFNTERFNTIFVRKDILN